MNKTGADWSRATLSFSLVFERLICLHSESPQLISRYIHGFDERAQRFSLPWQVTEVPGCCGSRNDSFSSASARWRDAHYPYCSSTSPYRRETSPYSILKRTKPPYGVGSS